jgi:hypothetical protein
MSRRSWTILIASVIVVSLGTEFAVRRWHAAKSCVEVVNDGGAPMDELVIGYAETNIALGRLDVGQSTKAWFTPAGRGALTLDFNQKNSALKGFQVPDFDPVGNRRNGFKLVLIVKNDRVERFMEDDETTTSAQDVTDRIREWLRP